MRVVASARMRPTVVKLADLERALRSRDPHVRRQAEKTRDFAKRYGRQP